MDTMWSDGPDGLDIDVQSFSYSWRKNGKMFISMYGEVRRRGMDCRFAFETRNGQYHLEFPRAIIRDGSDPRETALAVKNVLVKFLRESAMIPDRYREHMMNCVYKHHEQRRLDVPLNKIVI
jgi:hypothetical protein